MLASVLAPVNRPSNEQGRGVQVDDLPSVVRVDTEETSKQVNQ